VSGVLVEPKYLIEIGVCGRLNSFSKARRCGARWLPRSAGAWDPPGP
jgi:hypothetical protein